MKKLTVVLGCIIILIGGVYFAKQMKLSSYETGMKEHFITDLKMDANELLSVNAFQAKGGDGGVTISVIFADEPEIKYYYKRIKGSFKLSETLKLDGASTRGKRS